VERQDNQNADGPRHGDGKDQQQLGISRDPTPIEPGLVVLLPLKSRHQARPPHTA